MKNEAALTLRQKKSAMKALLGRYDTKHPPCMNARVLRDAVVFSAQHQVEIPAPHSDLIATKWFGLLHKHNQLEGA